MEEEKKATTMVTIPEAEFKKLNEKINMLTEIADKGRLYQYMSRHQDFKSKVVGLNVIDGKVIRFWYKVKDIVDKNPLTGIWHEDQIIGLIFIDGAKKEIPYLEFIRNKQLMKTEVIKQTKINDANGEHTIITVDLDGQKIDIDATFVN